MKVDVLYFAGLREALGTARETLHLPDDVRTAGALRDLLAQRGGAWQDRLAPARNVRVAVGQALADASTPLSEGAEVAFFPPVTGG